MTEELSYSYRGTDGTRIRIIVEPSIAHANICRFIIEPPVYPEGGIHFARGSDTTVSPLATRLFELGGIAEVLIASNAITLTTDDPVEWAEFSANVAGVIRDQFNSGIPSVADTFTKNLPPPEEIRGKVQEVIDSAINPAVASHGGFVKLLDVKGNNVFLEFGGGCQGCGMVSVTLKYGVERLLRERVPAIGQVLDTTDHASGTNPYYAPSAK